MGHRRCPRRDDDSGRFEPHRAVQRPDAAGHTEPGDDGNDRHHGAGEINPQAKLITGTGTWQQALNSGWDGLYMDPVVFTANVPSGWQYCFAQTVTSFDLQTTPAILGGGFSVDLPPSCGLDTTFQLPYYWKGHACESLYVPRANWASVVVQPTGTPICPGGDGVSVHNGYDLLHVPADGEWCRHRWWVPFR